MSEPTIIGPQGTMHKDLEELPGRPIITVNLQRDGKMIVFVARPWAAAIDSLELGHTLQQIKNAVRRAAAQEGNSRL